MKIFISAFLFLFILNSFSQTAPVKTTFIIKKQAVTNYDSIKKDYSPLNKPKQIYPIADRTLL